MDKGIDFKECKHARDFNHDTSKFKSKSEMALWSWHRCGMEAGWSQRPCRLSQPSRVSSFWQTLWNLVVQDPVSQAKHPQGNSAFRVLLNCVRTVWMNRFIPAKIKGKVDWVKIWCHQGLAVCDSDFCMICVSDAIRLHIPGPSGALSVWGYRTGSDFSGNPPAKNL